MSKKRVIALHTRNIVGNPESTQLEKAFAEGLKAKAYKDGVPGHIFESVIHDLADTDRNENVNWDNCPDGKCDVPIKLADIWGYGCWCNFPVLGRGSGPILDEYDHACNFLSRCNRCAKHDADEAGGICDPATEDFNVNVRWDMKAMGLTGDCAISNDNDCDTHLCSCQMTFISRLLDVLWGGAEVSSINFHQHEDWNGNRCKGGEMPTAAPTTIPADFTAVTADSLLDTVHTPFTLDNGHDSQFLCCGFYPDRFSYNADSWGCCETEDQRNPFKHAAGEQCCNDGSVVKLGEVCA